MSDLTTTYDHTGDVVMTDIEDESIVHAITEDLSRTRHAQNAPRQNQPFDVRMELMRKELRLTCSDITSTPSCGNKMLIRDRH